MSSPAIAPHFPDPLEQVWAVAYAVIIETLPSWDDATFESCVAAFQPTINMLADRDHPIHLVVTRVLKSVDLDPMAALRWFATGQLADGRSPAVALAAGDVLAVQADLARQVRALRKQRGWRGRLASVNGAGEVDKINGREMDRSRGRRQGASGAGGRAG